MRGGDAHDREISGAQQMLAGLLHRHGRQYLGIFEVDEEVGR